LFPKIGLIAKLTSGIGSSTLLLGKMMLTFSAVMTK
jgi:hypothetical protein